MELPKITEIRPMYVSGENIGISIQVDRMAVSPDGIIHLISFVCDVYAMRGARAFMMSNRKGSVYPANNIHVGCDTMVRPNPNSSRDFTRRFERFDRCTDGYTGMASQLEHGNWHCLLISRNPKFMMGITPDDFWKQINHDRFTTPVLKEWVPTLMVRAARANQFFPLWGFQTVCGYVTFETEHLDTYVTEELTKGTIWIPKHGSNEDASVLQAGSTQGAA